MDAAKLSLIKDGHFTWEETRMKEGKDQHGWRKNKHGKWRGRRIKEGS